MEIHRELGKGHDEVIYKDALVVELNRAGIPFSREKNYEITYKGVILPHYYYADFVVWQKILFEAKARKTDRFAPQTSVELSGCLETPRRGCWSISVVMCWNGNGSFYKGEFVFEASNLRVNSWNSCLITADERNV